MILSDTFFQRLADMGVRRNTDPAVWLAVWNVESGLNPAARNPHGGAQGLNQMMPATLRGLGAPANFADLAAEDQLPWIEKLIASGERINGGPFTTSGRYYWSNFYPATMVRGDSPDAVVVSSQAASSGERQAYEWNTVLDANKDGTITQGDLQAVVDRNAKSASYQAALSKLRTFTGNPSPQPTPLTWEIVPSPVPAFVATRAKELLGQLSLGQQLVEKGDDGRTYKYVCETHPPDRGINVPHKGITVWRLKGEVPSPSTTGGGDSSHGPFSSGSFCSGVSLSQLDAEASSEDDNPYKGD